MARRRARVLAWANPTRFVTLTCAPDDWQALRAKVRKLTMRLRAEGYRVEWAWTVERGSKTGMKHVHALQHGDFIPQRTLQSMWGPITHIERVRGSEGAATYAMKEASRVAGYTMKGSRSNLHEHLALNGGRAYHMSRGYLRGHRTRDVERIVDGVDVRLTWITIPAETPIDAGQAIAASC
jgi:hypothetical protein